MVPPPGRMPACHCGAQQLSLSRRKLLRTGGAGFVAGLVATMIGAGRSAQARTLQAAVPAVEGLSIRIVSDNLTRRYVPTQKFDGLTVERAQGAETPDAPPRAALLGEWGLSLHAESRRGDETRRVMVDYGYNPVTLLNNLDLLKIDPRQLDALVLSHGHYDHFGGLNGFLSATRGQLKNQLPFFVGGEDCFCARTAPNGGQYGVLDRQAILDANLMLMLAEGPALVADHAFTTGKIAQSGFEKPLRSTSEKIGVANGFGCFPEGDGAGKKAGETLPDDFAHEIATVYLLKGKGLVILTSCSHRGVINTIRQAQAASGVRKVHAVIGGFHLVPPLDEAYVLETIVALKEIDPDYLMPAHCSGEAFYDLARREMPGKVFQSYVGTRFVFTS